MWRVILYRLELCFETWLRFCVGLRLKKNIYLNLVTLHYNLLHKHKIVDCLGDPN